MVPLRRCLTPVASAVRLLGVGLMLGLLMLGCEEDVVAVLEPQQPFSLYGILTPQSEVQRIRVFPIEGELQPARPDKLDARLTSTDNMTGETRVWRDTVFQEIDGQYAYAFWSPFRADFGHSYQIEVERSDRARTHVKVQVPPETEGMIDEASAGRVIQSVRVRGGAPRLIRVEVTYLVEYIAERAGELRDFIFTLPYDDRASEVGEDWVVQVDLRGDFSLIQKEVVAVSYVGPSSNPATYDRLYGIRLKSIALGYIVANEEWNPPGGVFDLDVLAQPGVMSNVENGFGFVGAGYRSTVSWLPDAEAMREAGFSVPDL